MDFNNLVFPSPNFLYENLSNFNDELIYIPKPNNQEHIPCILLLDHSGHQSKNFLLIFHGNAEDIFQARKLGTKLRESLYMNILIIEYPGYGIYQSSEKSSETILENTTIIYDFIKKTFKITDENIFIFGRSIGTSPAIYTASKRNPNALFIISAFTSLKSVAGHLVGILKFLLKDRFNSIDYIKNVKCPILMIHGQSDSLIPFKETLILKENCNCPVEINLPERMTHNDFDIDEDIIIPIVDFIQKNCDVDKEKIQFDEEFKNYFNMPNEILKIVNENKKKKNK